MITKPVCQCEVEDGGDGGGDGGDGGGGDVSGGAEEETSVAPVEVGGRTGQSGGCWTSSQLQSVIRPDYIIYHHHYNCNNILKLSF